MKRISFVKNDGTPKNSRDIIEELKDFNDRELEDIFGDEWLVVKVIVAAA